MSAGRLGDRYALLEELGRGATAVVYRARDEQLRTDVALKLLAPHLTRDPAAVGRLRRELHAARQIACPAVAQVYDLGEDGDAVYLVMEYGPSGTLKDHLLLHGPLAPAALDRLLEEIASALEACHRQGVLHRDLKPSNILYDAGLGRVKLIDFGVARIAESADLGPEGSVVGTAEYMAPEQFDDPVPDPRSDLYSAGVVFYEAATGQSPFAGRTVPEVARKHHEGIRKRPREVNPALGRGAEAIILRLLATDPSDRFQTSGELLDALAGGSTGDGVSGDAPATGGRCPACAGRLAPGLPFCPACSVDLSDLARFGRWSVKVAGDPGESTPETDHLLRRLSETSLPQSAILRRDPDFHRRPLTLVQFASEPLASYLVERLRAQGVVARAQILGLTPALLITLFCSSLAGALLWILFLLIDGILWVMANEGMWAWSAGDPNWILNLFPNERWLAASVPFVAGGLVTGALVLVRRLRASFGTAVATVSPVARRAPVASPIVAARAAQSRLENPRLRAIGGTLVAAAHRLLQRDERPEATAKLLATSFDLLRGLDRQFAALQTRGEPAALRIARQDAIVTGQQALLRLSALWRRAGTTALARATSGLAAAVTDLDREAGELAAARDELIAVERELGAIAPAPLEPARERRA